MTLHTIEPESREPQAARIEAAAVGVDDLSETEPVEEDLLVEDISIDGMCGVY